MRLRLLVSWTWFFLVLFSYYVLKPVRDALATETRLFGPLYLATFLAVCAALPLYWRIVGRTTRWQLVFGVYQFFVACMVAFAVLLARGHGDAAWLRNAFFVWVSVFNLYVVAVFWSVMADLFSAEEGKTWFGAVAASGTTGSIVARPGGVTDLSLGPKWIGSPTQKPLKWLVVHATDGWRFRIPILVDGFPTLLSEFQRYAPVSVLLDARLDFEALKNPIPGSPGAVNQ